MAGYQTIEGPEPPWWLRVPQVQTLWASLWRPAPDPAYRRERRDTPDGDFVDLDWVDADDLDAPLVLGMHGFEGNSQSRYLRRLMQAVREIGWNGVAFNLRSCSGENNRRLGAYHSGLTDDLDWLVTTEAARRPRRPILLVGYSLGGNVLGCWLGKQPGRVPEQVAGAMFCSTPFRLDESARVTELGFNRVYLWNFLRTIRPKLIDKAALYPGAFDLDAALRARTLPELDDAATAPIFGFVDHADYYEQASSCDDLPAIRVPALILHADDDPLVPRSALPDIEALAGSPVHLEIVPRGAHLGFADRDDPGWLEQRILSWLTDCLARRGDGGG